MPAAAVDALISARLTSFLTDSPPPMVATLYPANTVASPVSTDDAFFVIQYPVVNGEKPSLERHYCEEGAARIVGNFRRRVETEDAYAVMDLVASLYRDRKFGSGLETFTPSGPIVNDTSDDANWFSLSVIAPYRYQFED